MSASAIRAGRAFVELFTKDDELRKGLARAQSMIGTFAKRVDAIGNELIGFGAFAAAPLALAIKSASNLHETMSKFGVVFGEQAGDVKKWGDAFAQEVGRSKRQIADFLASSQDLFVPLGFDPQRATELSKQITRLAVDLASFGNKADSESLRDLQSALTGSGETMKKYGVIVSEAAVKQELLNQKIDPSRATEMEKVLARLNIILGGTTAAQGDATRTAGSFANQQKRLLGALDDTASEIGTQLLPVITPLLSRLADVAAGFGKWAAENDAVVKTIAGVVAQLLLVGGTLKSVSALATAVVATKPWHLLAAAIGVVASQLVVAEDNTRSLRDRLADLFGDTFGRPLGKGHVSSDAIKEELERRERERKQQAVDAADQEANRAAGFEDEAAVMRGLEGVIDKYDDLLSPLAIAAEVQAYTARRWATLVDQAQAAGLPGMAGANAMLAGVWTDDLKRALLGVKGDVTDEVRDEWLANASADMDDAIADLDRELQERQRETQQLLDRDADTLRAGSEEAAKALLQHMRQGADPAVDVARQQLREAEKGNRELAEIKRKLDGPIDREWKGIPITVN